MPTETKKIDTLVAIEKLQEIKNEKRQGQRQMALAIEKSITDTKSPLLFQAGTGVGKSFAYLVPAIVSGKKVVVSTGSIALQNQLAKKDLPFMQEFFLEHFGISFDFALLKGKGNFICKAKAKEIANNVPEQEDILGSIRAARAGLGGRRRGRTIEVTASSSTVTLEEEIQKLIEFSETSATGDEADVDWESPNLKALWSSFATTNNDCPGASNCPFGSECYAENARALAMSADIVVVNNHFYALDIAFYSKLIPPHDVVIFDEAHMVADAWSSIFGSSLTAESLLSAHKAYKKAMGDPPFSRKDQMFISRVEDFKGKIALFKNSIKGVSKSAFVKEGVSALFSSIKYDLSTFKEDLRKRKESTSSEEIGAKCTRAMSIVTGRIEDFTKITSFIDEERSSSILWCTDTAFNLTPIDLADFVSDRWGEVTPIFCSASSQKNDLDIIGLGKSAKYFEIPSPFPYEKNAVLYVPETLSAPPKGSSLAGSQQEKDYDRAVANEIRKLLYASRGRALVLFSSKRAMNAAYEHFTTTKDVNLPYNLYCQNNTYTNSELVKLFTEDTSSVLFATRGFWQGIDVPGESCSLVVIDRIPFPHVQDPVSNQRRDRLGQRAFAEFDIPHAVSNLLQGVGRLIRTREDRGVVAVLDTRLAEAKYGKDIYRHLPPMRLTRRFEVVKEFFS